MASASPIYLPAGRGVSAKPHLHQKSALLRRRARPAAQGGGEPYLSSNILATARVRRQSERGDGENALPNREPLRSATEGGRVTWGEGRGARAGRDSGGKQRGLQWGLCQRCIRVLPVAGGRCCCWRCRELLCFVSFVRVRAWVDCFGCGVGRAARRQPEEDSGRVESRRVVSPEEVLVRRLLRKGTLLLFRRPQGEESRVEREPKVENRITKSEIAAVVLPKNDRDGFVPLCCAQRLSWWWL